MSSIAGESTKLTNRHTILRGLGDNCLLVLQHTGQELRNFAPLHSALQRLCKGIRIAASRGGKELGELQGPVGVLSEWKQTRHDGCVERKAFLFPDGNSTG